MTINSPEQVAKAEKEVVHEQQAREKVTNEEFKIWKKSVPLLYDTIHTHVLDYPSLTVKWLSDLEFSEDKSKVVVKFLYGTNSSQHSQDYLKLGSIDLPATLAGTTSKLSTPKPGESTTNFKVLSTWKHNGEVNKLEISPNGQNVITFDNEGIVHLYNLADQPVKDFKYHKLEGYALEWLNDIEFLSGSNDSQIALWDVSKPSTPIQCFKSHNAVINDLSLNRTKKSIFASTADDYSVKVHDLRAAPTEESVAINIKVKHIQNAVKFHPEIPSLLISGGKDNVVNLYDIRNPSEPFRKLYGHNDSISGLRWDTENPNSFVSWGLDKRTIIWDLNSLDEEFVHPTEATETSRKRNVSKVDPCLKFISGGHTNRINEIDIHPKINSLFATCGDEGLLEVWKPKTILEEEENEEEKDAEDNMEEE